MGTIAICINYSTTFAKGRSDVTRQHSKIFCKFSTILPEIFKKGISTISRNSIRNQNFSSNFVKISPKIAPFFITYSFGTYENPGPWLFPRNQA